MDNYPVPRGHDPTVHRKSLIYALYLLRIEKKNLSAVRDTIRIATDGAVAALVRMWPSVDEVKLAQSLIIIRARSQWLEEQTARAILSARRVARTKAAEAVGHQTAAMAKSLQKANVPIDDRVMAALAPSTVVDHEQDTFASTVAAKSYSARWLAASGAALALAVQNNKKLTKAPDDASDSSEAALKTIVVTETSKAFNDEIRRQIERIRTSIAGSAAESLILKRWTAVLEPNTCGVCSHMDGQTVALNEDFEDGRSPGHVHPNCRCIVTMALLNGEPV